MADVKLQLELVDVYGKPLAEKVDIILRHQVLNETLKASKPANKNVLIPGLRGAPQGRYKIDVDPPSYQYVAQFVNMNSSGTTSVSFQFPIDPGKVKRVNFQAYASLTSDLQTLLEASDKVIGFEGSKGRQLYDALDNIRKAGMLNIVAKTVNTPLSNGRSVFSYIQKLNEVRGDRFFCVVPKELRQEAKNSTSEGLFDDAPDTLHTPPPGFSRAGSVKTPDKYGNLQLTFFTKGDDCLADIDIDDASGLEHVFQVVRNKLSGNPTHPYHIHEILVAYQKIDPGYTFVI